jgi:hypothetical protein
MALTLESGVFDRDEEERESGGGDKKTKIWRS